MSRVRRGCLVLAGWLLAATPLHAAQHNAAEFQSLMAQAQARGAVRVMVSLHADVGLQDSALRRAQIASVVPRQTQALLAELGETAWKAGYWNNGLGQLGLYLTPDGLRYLAASGNARSFGRDPTDRMRTRVPSTGGQLLAIERDLDAQGWADVELTLNLESLDFDVGVDRVVRFRSVNAAEAAESRGRLLGQLNARHALDISQAHRAAAGPSPRVSLRLTREGYALLREHPQVRSLRRAGATDTRAAEFQPAALAHAKAHGSAEVLIELRGGDTFSPAQGHLPARAWNNQLESMRRAFREILGPGIAEGVMHQQDFSEVRSLAAHMSHAALLKLYANADPRILRVRLNEPVATGGVATSTVLTNMPQAWAAGHRGAGQTIVVIDSGVKRSHEFFKMNGVSKIVGEFCAGTNSGSYRSICPAPNGLGDSPLNYPGAGEPQSFAKCPASNLGQCTHGTHVAGIAAGRASTKLPAGLQGVAPDATIVSAQVFSFDPATGRGSIFLNDLYAAMQSMYTQSSGDSYTVNASIYTAGKVYDADCWGLDQTFEDYVALLLSRNIPFVTITGNGFQRTGVSWPACTPNAVKVAATNNSGTGNVGAAESNFSNPWNYTGAVMVAPGYNVASASIASTTASVLMGGTSQAAPHVAGYFAAVKAASPGILVGDALAWMLSAGSVPMFLDGYEYRRINAPAF